MRFKIGVRKVNGVPVIGIVGELSGEHVGKVAARLEKLRKAGEGTIAVDLSRTTFIDSNGLGVFVYSWRLLENEQRGLVFVNPQGFILNMFHNTNLDRIFKIVGSIGEL
jgi:anti-sigma B factor antagonist